MSKIIALLLSVLVVVISPQECKYAAECRPRECCHSTSAVPSKLAPDCTDIMCDTQCIDGAVDCNAEIGCVGGLCVVSKEYLLCERDEDCDEYERCHPKHAIRKEFVPYISRTCSTNCEVGSIDCGQGKVVCQRNNCTTIFFRDEKERQGRKEL
eukprot:TRINITY_DN459_c1_g1_i2.p1 TRINITY_DN459_c1_g1~~TRINITY_DN459_c1_g1_i2.p1  ORF type:complete len:154 (+),score=16.21 TRINITY_DN459_c1_g1_i2:652-1113(+)